MTLHAYPRDSSARARLVADLFNRVHSVDAFMAGIKLALLLKMPPKDISPDSEGPVRLFWIEPRKLQNRSLTLQEFVRVAPRLSVDTVLLARARLGRDAERALRTLGFWREVPNQITGFWYRSAAQVPPEMPSTLPTGAVLPQLGRSPWTGEDCLDMVQVDYVWYPLSEAGLYSYGHSADLTTGDGAVFVPVDSAATPWPTVFAARLGNRIGAQEVEARYGAHARERAREDYPSVQVQLMLVPQ